MTASPRAVFFGNEQLATGVSTSLPLLNALHDSGVQIAAIVTSAHQATSRSRHTPAVSQFAEQHGIPLLCPRKPADIIDQLAGYQADCGILAAYGHIIPQSLIDIFPHGIINLHPSALPTYRGPTPIEQTILDGLNRTAVSIMALTAGMDEGPLYTQEPVVLTGRETKQALADQLGQVGAAAIVHLLPAIISGQAQPIPQQGKASYTQRITKAMGQLDPAAHTAEQLERFVRAYAGWPKTRLQLNNHEVIVTQAHAGNNGSLVISCAEGTYLSIDQLQAPNGKTMDAASFLRGYANK